MSVRTVKLASNGSMARGSLTCAANGSFLDLISGLALFDERSPDGSEAIAAVYANPCTTRTVHDNPA